MVCESFASLTVRDYLKGLSHAEGLASSLEKGERARTVTLKMLGREKAKETGDPFGQDKEGSRAFELRP